MIIPMEKGDSLQSIAAELTDSVVAQLPQEKAQAERDMDATGRMLQATGSLKTKEGLGQRVASVPARLYHRWNQLYPGCWKEKEFVAEFLVDNPQCRAPGYRPKDNGLRNSFTFINGESARTTKRQISGGAAVYHAMKAAAIAQPTI